jgi:hypothetical protein
MNTSEVESMDKFIMVVQPKAQEELAALGFTYTKTEINGKTVYAFADTEALQRYLAEKFSDEEWHYMKRNLLCF